MDEPKAGLIEPPIGEMDQLALVNEVLAKRQEEAEELRIRLSNLRHQIQQEKIHWEDQRRQEEAALRLKQMQQDQDHAHRLNELDVLKQARQAVLDQAETERRLAVSDRVALAQAQQQLGDLNHERVEVERLRAHVVHQSQESNQRFQEAQTALNTANQRLEESNKKFAEIEAQTARLSQWQASLQAQQQEYDVKAKHLNIVQETIGQIVEKLPVPERQESSAVNVAESPVPSGVIPQEVQPKALPPTEPLLASLPPLPAGVDLGPDIEIAPQVTPIPSESPTSAETDLPQSADPKVQAWLERHQVHPSQKARVLDPSKPLNDQ